MLDRRHFLIAGGLVPAGFLGLRHLMSDRPLYKDADLVDPGYGPLQRDPRGILDLPEGFRYRIVSWAGQTMSDGLFLPGAPDGMAAFPGPDGLAVVICNHELTVQSDRGPFGRDNRRLELLDRGKIYDYGEGKTPSCGGTTTFLFDPARQEIVSQFLSLAGTIRNCAGGATPWNSWISCEETVRTAGHDEEAGLWAEQDHGYNFEVPATTRMEVVDPVPLRAMGRFNHEAVAVAEETGIVYQTEDRGDGLLYRFLPESPGKLQAGGRLQALKIRDRSGMDTRNWNLWRTISVGEPVAVEWIDLDDRNRVKTTCDTGDMRPAPPASPGEKACGTATKRSISPAPTAGTVETGRSGSTGRVRRKARRRRVKRLAPSSSSSNRTMWTCSRAPTT